MSAFSSLAVYSRKCPGLSRLLANPLEWIHAEHHLGPLAERYCVRRLEQQHSPRDEELAEVRQNELGRRVQVLEDLREHDDVVGTDSLSPVRPIL